MLKTKDGRVDLWQGSGRFIEGRIGRVLWRITWEWPVDPNTQGIRVRPHPQGIGPVVLLIALIVPIVLPILPLLHPLFYHPLSFPQSYLFHPPAYSLTYSVDAPSLWGGVR